jgi:hypothetical protein
MATEIHYQGGSVEVVESFTLVRQRVNRAMINWEATKIGEEVFNTKGEVKKAEPTHDMTFTIADENGEPVGRVVIKIEKFIAVTSDELNDK